MKLYLGKIIGALIGVVSGGPFGLLIGAFAGHLIDQKLTQFVNARKGVDESEPRTQIQQAFFRATFRMMGHLAKADGRVSEQEISAATRVMDTMALQGAQRQQAIQYFTEGKDQQFDFAQDLGYLKLAFQQQPELAQMFLEIQLSVAHADGKLSVEERRLFDRVCRGLHISAFQFEWINSRIEAAVSGNSSQKKSESRAQAHQQKSSEHTQKTYQRKEERKQQKPNFGAGMLSPMLRNAYAVLGVGPYVDDDELKKSYRKLMSQHHPDKLVSKGLPETMMKLAKEKTQEIQTAYDLIRRSRRGL